MSTYPEDMRTRGPIPLPVGGPVTLVAQEDMTENAVVTFGTEDQTCIYCGADDFPLGWLQAAVDEDGIATVFLWSPMWLMKVADTSATITFGDTLECAASGTVIRAVDGSSSSIFGKAMQDGVAGGLVLAIPAVCCPSYTST